MPSEERERLLDPVDRISEILFGLIMAVTIVGSLSIATAGRDEMRMVTIAALGCNLAWGLVDAVMYLVRTVTERTRLRALARRIVHADAETARDLMAGALPDALSALAGTAELDGMRQRLSALPRNIRPLLGPRDLLEAFGIFLMVVIATFPVVAPFMMTSDAGLAIRLSNGIALGMLFLAGFGLGRHADHPKPLVTGVVMAVLGALLIGAVKALGG
jgi:VIT1/CCC1 family predicted Fe2+/Mn2+ transporter